MQSSEMNSVNARLKTSIHSPAVSRSGPAGVWPTSERLSAAADDGEAANARLLVAFAAPAEEQACCRPDAAGEEEARPDRARRRDRQVRAQLRRDVRRLTHFLAKLFDGVREALALLLDVLTDLFRGARATCHCSSAPPASASPRESPAREP